MHGHTNMKIINVCINCMYQLYVSAVCINCMYSTNCMYQLYVSTVCTNWMYQLYVSAVCINCMYQLYISTLCISCMYQLYVSTVCTNCMYQLYISTVCISHIYQLYSWLSNKFLVHRFVLLGELSLPYCGLLSKNVKNKLHKAVNIACCFVRLMWRLKFYCMRPESIRGKWSFSSTHS